MKPSIKNESAPAAVGTEQKPSAAAGADSPQVLTRSKTVELGKMFLPYQVNDIFDTARYQVREKARRIGETFGYGYKYARKRAVKQGKTWYTANDSSTVLEFIDYIAYFGRMFNSFFEVVDEEMVVEEDNILTKVVRFRDGGQVIGLSSNPTALHGKGGDFIGDEFAYHKQAQTMWEAGQAIAAWGDDIIVLSTHTSIESQFNQIVTKARKLYAAAKEKGIEPRVKKNGYWEITEEFRKLALSRGDLPWSYRRTTIHDAVAQGYVEKINATKGTRYTREEFLAECRAKCLTEDQWKRQYECEPSSDASSLLPYNLILPCASDTCLKALSSCQNIFQGVDFARRGHNTSVSSAELLGDVLWLRDLFRLKGAKWSEQLLRISSIVGLPNFRKGCYDRTGLGDMPVETLQDKFGSWRIEGVLFSPQSKANLANPLRHRFEDKTIRIPNDQALFDSLNKIRATTTTDGRTIFVADDADGEHGDDFWSLALANAAASNSTGMGNFRAELLM